MSEEYQREPLPPFLAPYEPYPRLTVIERYNISPILFAALSLLFVFILYQMVGGVLTFLLFGLRPGATEAAGFRLVTGLGQVFLIFIPTLLLVRLVTFEPAKHFRVKVPDIRLIGLTLIGIFSLQQVLQIIIVFQDKIPLPRSIERLIEPLKEAIEELMKTIVGATTIPELLFVVLIVALIPAICEEFLFRGLVQPLFEKSYGSWKGIVITGTIFGLYHLNPFELIPLAMLGIYLGFLTMRAGSIWVSVVAHFFNNALACVALYLHLDDDAVVTGSSGSMTTFQLLLTALVCGAIFLLSTYYFLLLTKKAPEGTDRLNPGSAAL